MRRLSYSHLPDMFPSTVSGQTMYTISSPTVLTRALLMSKLDGFQIRGNLRWVKKVWHWLRKTGKNAKRQVIGIEKQGKTGANRGNGGNWGKTGKLQLQVTQ